VTDNVLDQLRKRGACAGANPNIFFPEDEKDLVLVGKALVYCSGCPVLDLCRRYAMDNEDYGIWGGTTARQRRSLRRKAKKEAKK
jgi:WhiB family redox-sensing transcriptional regulator